MSNQPEIYDISDLNTFNSLEKIRIYDYSCLNYMYENVIICKLALENTKNTNFLTDKLKIVGLEPNPNPNKIIVELNRNTFNFVEYLEEICKNNLKEFINMEPLKDFLDWTWPNFIQLCSNIDYSDMTLELCTTPKTVVLFDGEPYSFSQLKPGQFVQLKITPEHITLLIKNECAKIKLTATEINIDSRKTILNFLSNTITASINSGLISVNDSESQKSKHSSQLAQMGLDD